MELRDGDSKDILLNALSTLSAKVKENYKDKVSRVALEKLFSISFYEQDIIAGVDRGSH